MALKNGSSQTIGMPDLIETIRAFEHQNQCRITLSSKLILFAGRTDMEWIAKAFEDKENAAGRGCLAFASVRCMEKRLVTMEAVLLNLLYTLDFQLAEGEMQKFPPKRA